MQLAFEHRSRHAHIFQPLGAELERVIFEHRKVGLLACGNGADLIVQAQSEGRVDGDATQRLIDAEHLFWRDLPP